LPWRYALGLTCPEQYRHDTVMDRQWVLRAEIIWHKLNGLPESVTDRVRRSHEQWFHFTKEGRYFAAIDEVRERHVYADDTTRHLRGTRNVTPDGRDSSGNTSGLNPLGKLPGSVWSVPSEPLVVPDHLGVDHFAAYPQELPRRLVLGWSPAGICTKCREGRRPVREVDWSKVPHRMERKRVLNAAQSAAWCSTFTDWCDARGITRQRLDAVAGTTDMGGWWASRLPHRSQVPTPEQWAKLADAFGPLPDDLTEVVHFTELVPVAERDAIGSDVAGKHRMTGGGLGEAVMSITGYACACDVPLAATRPAVVFDPFVGTGTTVGVARALGRYGIGLDLSADYLRLATWRVWRSGHFAKTDHRTNRERQGALPFEHTQGGA
jgi:hypothetical protein